MAKGEIVSIRDIVSQVGDPTTALYKEVQYKIDGQGNYTLYLPAEGFTASKAIEAVEAKVAEWAQVVGKKIERT